MQSRLFVQSVEKALRVLQAFDETAPQRTLAQIADACGLSMGAAQRFVHTLHALGYLRRDAATKRYALSPRILRLGFSYLSTDTLIERARGDLEALNVRCEETVNLTELDDLEVVYVSRWVSRHSVSVNLLLGTRLPAYCTAPGRAILSRLPAAEAMDIVRRSDRLAFTPGTITDVDALAEAIAAAGRAGYALADQECFVGDISVAAAIGDADGRPVGAVNIAVPSTRWSVAEADRRLGPLVAETARRISAG